MSQSRFMNRQILYLRPDPARVVVRPFKPATEPRDLNPTDKTRANHIVGRVLQLDAAAAAQQLSDVVENFEGRHRNLLDIFETRAAEMVIGAGREGAAVHAGRICDRSRVQSRTAARRRGHNRTRQQLHIDGANASFSRRQR